MSSAAVCSIRWPACTACTPGVATSPYPRTLTTSDIGEDKLDDLERYTLRDPAASGQVTRKKDREQAAKRDATELRLWLAMQDGTRFVCQHPHAFHCDGPAGKHLGGCPLAECDCEAFIEDIFAGI